MSCILSTHCNPCCNSLLLTGVHSPLNHLYNRLIYCRLVVCLLRSITMEAYQARLDSFNKSSKRSKQSKASSSTHKWPHPSSYRATPQTLAEAGFYHDPSSEYKDNVTCFICEKQLADWDQDDDPFTIHWEKCGSSCPWAIVRCGLMEDTDDHGKCVLNPFRIPIPRLVVA